MNKAAPFIPYLRPLFVSSEAAFREIFRLRKGMVNMFRSDTIAAVATGMTDSGIGIVRISGENAVEIGNLLFASPSGKKILKTAESHKLYHGYLLDIDEVMAVVMRAPKSFTGEDTVEIHCHGGVLVMQKILEAALSRGARLAEPGEFTKRAFLNGKMDLSMAEAVIDVIHSQNEYALNSSFHQLKGILSDKIKSLRADIIYEIAFIESALDDPEHISLQGYPEKLSQKLDYLLQSLEKLLSTADSGRWIKEGINTVIVGKPNVGKSSLLNLILGEDRAIVTDIAGTTRDILQETVRLGGISLNIIDTAGIRDTSDTVEKMGVEKARKYAQNADLILYVVDGSVPLDENDREIVSFIRDKRVIVLLNKSDLSNVVTDEDICEIFLRASEGKKDAKGQDRLQKEIIMLRASMKDGSGIEELQDKIKAMFFHGEIKTSSEIVITNMRHREALQEALDSLKLVRKSIEDGLPEDFYSIDLMSAYSSLGRIIGEEVEDDLVEEIFSRFCMGK